jgi:hypothetical protein
VPDIPGTIRRNLDARVDALAAYTLRCLRGGRMPEVRFVLFGQGRTGSELLRSLLNTHPRVRCEGEILARPRLFPAAFVEGHARASDRPAYGFKAKVYQLSEDQHLDPRAFVRRLTGDGWQVVYLYRRNLLRQALSNVVARHRRAYHRKAGQDGPGLPKVRVDCDALLRSMTNRRNFLAEEHRVLDGVPHVEVVYEDDLLPGERHQQAADRVFRHLGLEPVEIRTDHLRVTSDRLADFVDNHEEVAACVGRTDFAPFLEG